MKLLLEKKVNREKQRFNQIFICATTGNMTFVFSSIKYKIKTNKCFFF